MSERKQTSFDRATGASEIPEIVEEGEAEQRSIVPRAVFTRDQKLDLSKLSIPLLRIAQGMTEEVKNRKAAIGQFVLTNFPAYDKVVLVPFGAPDIRQYKPDPKKPAQCQAPTGDFGFGNPGGVCAECPLSQWTPNPKGDGTNIPPPCKEGVLVRGYSITHRSLVDFQFMAGDRNKGGFIQSQAMGFGWGNFAVELTTGSKENQKGSWFVPQIEMLAEVPPDQLDIIAKWYEVFLASQVDTKANAVHMLQERTQ